MDHSRENNTYTSVSMTWSLVTLEKWDSRMVSVPVRATWPHPQNRATPEKQRIVATSDAYGTPPKHLMQHSKQPRMREKREMFLCKSIYSKSCTGSWPLKGIQPASIAEWAPLEKEVTFLSKSHFADIYKSNPPSALLTSSEQWVFPASFLVFTTIGASSVGSTLQ